MRTVLLLCLVLGLAMATVKGDEVAPSEQEEAEAVVVNSSGEADASEVADEDAETPTRQSQRAHLAERQQQVLNMRLQQVDQQSAISTESEAAAGTETERRRIRRWRKRGGRPFAHRVSGAARTFAPNDRMCVLCQFLVQRSQQDFASMYGVTVGPEGLSANLATAAATTPSVFVFAEQGAAASGLDEAEDEADVEAEGEDEDEASDEDQVSLDEAEELEDEEADEADNEADDEEETEEESEDESEDEEESDEESEDDSEEEESEEADSEDDSESENEEDAEDEDAAFLQIAEVESEEGESDSEWTTPEYANEQQPITAALIEQRASEKADNEGEWTTPEYTPEPVHESVEMETAEVAEQATEEEAAPENHDQVEAVFFESEALAASVKSDEGEGSEWTTPEYALAETAAAVKGEDEGEEQEQGGAEWQAPEYSDAMASSGVKEYAKVVQAANAEEAQSGILLESSNAVDTSSFQPRYFRGPARRRPRTYARHGTIASTPHRYKVSDRLAARPRWNRFDPYSPRHPNPQREMARAQFDKATHLSYDRLEAYCSTRLPELFGKFCRVVLRRFRKVAEGLRYGDRPNQVCMAIKMCPRGSYVRKNVHNVLKRFHRHP